jgi:hypothetical protein
MDVDLRISPPLFLEILQFNLPLTTLKVAGLSTSTAAKRHTMFSAGIQKQYLRYSQYYSALF